MNTKENLIKEIENNRGCNVYAVVRYISHSGMNRHIGFFVIIDNKLMCINDMIAERLNLKFNKKLNGLKINGCGMDMVFATLYSFYPTINIKEEFANNYNLI